MEFEIVVTKTAETDFDEAISYIAVSLANPGAASALADEFEMALKQISDNPFLFHHFKDSDGNNTEYRRYNIKTSHCFIAWKGNGLLSAGFCMPDVICTRYRWKSKLNTIKPNSV